mmetsp:Transcript_18437/g.43096  ORF Transcript_18437/g.43096 Transcript_18437/m.43096 type:complete len:200 (-) Transcript_18437:1478-2077(-)
MLASMPTDILLVVGKPANTWVHHVQWIHRHPPLLRCLRCVVLRAMTMLCWKTATLLFNRVLDLMLRLLDVNLRSEDKVLMKDIAAIVRVGAPFCDSVFCRQHWELLRVLWPSIVNGQALHAFARGIHSESYGHHKPEQVSSHLCGRTLAQVVCDGTIRLRRYKLVKQHHQRLHLARTILREVCKQMVVVLLSHRLQLLW